MFWPLNISETSFHMKNMELGRWETNLSDGHM